MHVHEGAAWGCRGADFMGQDRGVAVRSSLGQWVLDDGLGGLPRLGPRSRGILGSGRFPMLVAAVGTWTWK